MYENGDGVPQDYKQAVYWYTQASEQEGESARMGNQDAQIYLNNENIKY